MRYAIALLAVALIVLAAACGDGGDDTPGPKATAAIEATPTRAASAENTPSTVIIGAVGPENIWGYPESIETQLFECQGDMECVMGIMRANGAPEQAIDFLTATGWFMTSYDELGTVDLVHVFIPWRANSNFDWALVNGSPAIIYGEDVGGQLEPDVSDADYVALLDAYPGLVIWPADERFEAMDTVAGGQSFVFQYSLNDGCHACGTGYQWRVALNFAADGTYETAQLLDICLTEGGTPAPNTDIGACPDAS